MLRSNSEDSEIQTKSTINSIDGILIELHNDKDSENDINSVPTMYD